MRRWQRFGRSPKSRREFPLFRATSKPQGEKFLRVPVHEDPRCVVFYFDQIGREPVSAVDIINQVRELITRDCLLVMFENIPPRLVPKDANVLRGLETYCKDRRK